MINEEGSEGETGGKTTQVRDYHKLRLHCLLIWGLGSLVVLHTYLEVCAAIPVIEVTLWEF